MQPTRRAKHAPLVGEFFQHAEMGFAVLSLEDLDDPGSLKVVHVNDAAGRIAAIPAEIIGMQARDIPEAAQLEELKAVARVVREQRPADLGEIPGVFLPDRLFVVKAFPIPPNCCGLIFEDVTERRKEQHLAHESEQRFRTIFEASPGAICVFEPTTGRLLDANPRFVELVGYGSTAGLVGKRLDMLGMWTENDEYARLIDQLRAARSLRETTVTYRTYGGQVRRALVALELIEIDGKESALGLFLRA